MALSEAIINKIKVLIYEDKKTEAEELLMAESGLSNEEASSYIARMTSSLSGTDSIHGKPKTNKTAAFIVFGVGLIMWGLAVFFYVEKDAQLKNSYLATGIVVDYIFNEGAAPVISYEVDGTPYQFTSSLYSSPPAFELNETVEIYVNKDDPSDIIINSFVNKWLIVTIFATFGLVLDLIGILLIKLKSSAGSSNVDFLDSEAERMLPFDE